MKIICEREKLVSVFQTTASITPQRSPKPILRCVKLEVTPERALLMATDLDIGIRVEVHGIQVETPGVAVIPADRFGQILRESSDEKLRIEVDAHGILVRGERSEFKLPSFNPSEFPSVATFDEPAYHELPARLLRTMIHRTAFATDTESSRYALGGVLLEMDGERLIAVATDGRRLAKMEGPARAVGGHESSESATIVPTRSVQLIERALGDAEGDIQLAARANDVLLRWPRTTIYSRLVEGRFPRWRDVFPKRDDAIQIPFTVGPFHAALRQAAIVASQETRGIDFTFGEGTLLMTSSTAETGSARVELPVAYDGPAVTITLDHRFLSDFFRALEPDQAFTLEIANAESAAVFSTDDGYGYVVMPLARER